MPTGSSKYPPNWRLWHPNNGVVFQQPLYPALDSARFFAETPTAQKTAGTVTEHSLRTESTTMLDVTRRFDGQISTPGRIPARVRKHSVQISKLHDDGDSLEELLPDDRLGGIPIDVSGDTGYKAPTEEQGEDNGDNGMVTPPFTPLDYKLQSDVFQTAKEAPEGSAESYWSYTFYRGPNKEDDVSGKVRVHYCKNAQTAERALQYFLEERIIGLDLEWLADAHRFSGARRNVSLMQLASQSRIILLHLALYPSKDELTTPTLRKILEDPNITKLGVWIKGDCTRIKKWLGIETRSMFELSHLFKQVKYCSSGQHELVDKKLISLAHQVEEVMGLPLYKSQSVRKSDWTQPLDVAQIGYSASDAYAAVQLFAMLNHQREQLDPTPALPFHAEHGKPIPLPPGAKVSTAERPKTAVDTLDEGRVEAVDGMEELERLRAEMFEVLEDVRSSLTNAVVPDELADDRPIAKLPLKASNSKVDAGDILPQLQDPRIETAEAWVTEYRAKRGWKAKAEPAALRAYHIWHANADMDPDAVARLLRDPPLKTSTVVSYLLAAMHGEKLPYDKTRVETEIVPLAHFERFRYRSFFRALGTFPDDERA